MKKNLLLFLFLLPLTWAIAQRTERKQAYFKNLRGFSGSVTFEVTYNGFATVLAGKKGVLILKHYDAPDEDLQALLKAGYDLRGFPQSGYTPDSYAFVVEGQAKIGMLSFYGSTEDKAISRSKLHLSQSLGDFTTPEFQQSMKEAARKWQQENQQSHWEETGAFTDLEVTELYIAEFEETIRKILGKAAATRRTENAEDAVSEAQKAMMAGNLSRARDLLEKAYKLDPKNKRMIEASREYAQKKKEKDEREMENMIIEAELRRKQRERNEAAADANELKTLRSWKLGSPGAFSPQNEARLSELTKREAERSAARINELFEAGRERIRERSKQRMAAIDAEYNRAIAELNARSAREKSEIIAATERQKESIRTERFRHEEARLSKYGYHPGESQAAMKANVRKMAAEIPAGKFNEGLAPLKYFKYGYVNRNGDIIIPFKYDIAGDFHDGLASVGYEEIYLGNLYEEWIRKSGYINTSGKEVIPLIYEETSSFVNGLAFVGRNHHVGLINKSGTTIIPVEYQALDYTNVGLIRARKADKSGFLDEHTGKVVIPLKYEQAMLFSEGLAAVKLNGKWGFLDKNGQTVIQFQFDELKASTGFHNGLISVAEGGTTTTINRFGRRVDYSILSSGTAEGMTPFRSKDGKYGFLNEDYQLIAAPKYDEYKKFQDGIAMVRNDKKWGGIDRKGNIVIPFKYKNIGWAFFMGLLEVTDEAGNSGYIDIHGKEVIPLKYEKVRAFQDQGIAIVQKGEKYGIIDRNGKTVVPFKFEDLNEYELRRLGLIEAKQNGRIGFLNAKGKAIIPVTYDKVVKSFFGRTTATLMKDGKQGVFNAKGEEIVKVKFENIGDFKDGLARAMLNGKYGFIDSSGNTVIPFKYDTAYDFMRGFVEVLAGNQSFILNQKGEVQAGKDFIRVTDFFEGFAIVMQHGKFAYADETNRLITSFKYDFAGFFKDGMAMVGVQKKDHRSNWYGFIDHTGKEAIPLKYDGFDEKTQDYTRYFFEDGLVKAELNKRYGYVNKQGKEVIPVIYYQVGQIAGGLIRVNNYNVSGFPEAQQNKWAYFDRNGNKITDFSFTQARDFSDGYAYVSKDAGSGFIDHSGKTVIPFTKKYKRVDDFIGGAAIAYNGEAWGFINKKGEEVLPFEYADINTGMGYIALKKGTQYGVVDIQGKTVVPFEHKQLFFQRGGVFRSKENISKFVISMDAGKMALIRLSDGKQITGHRFDYISIFYGNDLTAFKIGDKWGVLNQEGREILPAEYQEIKLYNQSDFLAVRYNGKWGVVNKFGSVVIPARYESVYRRDSDIVAVKASGDPDIYDAVNFEMLP